MLMPTAHNQPQLFNPRWCNICLLDKTTMEINPKLKKCSACHLVQYCGSEHQKKDWPVHKDFCRAVQKVMKDHNVPFVFVVNGAPTTFAEMKSKVFQVKYLVRNALKRNLYEHETYLISFPNVCANCYTNRNLRPCQNCQGVSYCSLLCKHKGDQWHDAQMCHNMRVYYCIYKFKINYPLMKVGDQNVQSVHMNFVARVDELCGQNLKKVFFRTTQQRMPDEPYNSLEEYQTFSDAGSLSCIASICYSMEYTKLPDPVEEAKFVVFIVGAKCEPSFYFCEVQTKFFFLQYPQFTTLELYFIGPEVGELVAEEFVYNFQFQTRKVINHHYKGLFQDFCKENLDIQPSFIVSYNCGFSERTFQMRDLNVQVAGAKEDIPPDTWADGILHMLRFFDTPIILTAMSYCLATYDCSILNEVAKTSEVPIHIECIMPLHANPYGDPRPVPTIMSIANEQVFHRCSFIRGLCTRKNPL